MGRTKDAPEGFSLLREKNVQPGTAKVNSISKEPDSMVSSAGTEEPSQELVDAVSSRGGGEGLRYYGPSPGWQLVNWRELWQHRELLWTLGVRDLKVRYRQTLIGVAWAVIQPVATMVIFLVLFSLLGQGSRPRGTPPYGLVLLCGLLPWQLFAAVVTRATVSLVDNQPLVTKVYFPRLVLPLSTAISSVVDFAVAFVVLAGLLLWYGLTPSWGVLAVPALVVLTIVAGLAVGVGLAAAQRHATATSASSFPSPAPDVGSTPAR